jgi:hypothetical protein
MVDAQRLYFPADRAGAALSCDECVVFLRGKSILVLTLVCYPEGKPSLSIGQVLGISLSSQLVPKHCLPFRKFHQRRSATEEARKGAPARPVAESPRATQADVVICRGAKGAKRSGFARRRSPRRCRKMRSAAPVRRTARENQKARAAGAGGRSTSNRISPSRGFCDSCQAMLYACSRGACPGLERRRQRPFFPLHAARPGKPPLAAPAWSGAIDPSP